MQIFQSTLPLRGATFSMRLVQHIVSISIHTPLAGSDGTARPWSRPCGNFNPHSPCGERRTVEPQYKFSFLFQSTLPLRGATVPPRHAWRDGNISIHTPLAGSDYYPVSQTECAPISIHTPLAGSDFATPQVIAALNVISIHTPLAGSDVFGGIVLCEHAHISIHTPLAGSDRRDR